MNFKDYVEDKKLLLIGPSEILEEEIKNINFKDYDLICTFNNHYKNEKFNNIINISQTNIIFHSMVCGIYNHEDFKLFNNNNIFLVSVFDYLNHSYNLDNRHKGKKQKYFVKINNEIPLDNFHGIPFSLGYRFKKILSAEPYCGIYCILYLLELNIKSITTCGFDFYDTNYIGNNISLESGKKFHKNDTQKENFIKYIKSHKNRDKLFFNNLL